MFTNAFDKHIPDWKYKYTELDFLVRDLGNPIKSGQPGFLAETAKKIDNLIADIRDGKVHAAIPADNRINLRKPGPKKPSTRLETPPTA